MKRAGSILLGLLIFCSCAFDPNSDSIDPNDRREQERRSKLVGIYEGIKGNYTGQLKSADGIEPAQLTISYYEVETGRLDSGGQPVYQPKPFGKFIMPESDDLDANMDASYDENTGHLTMTTRKIGMGGFDGPRLGVQGKLIGTHFSGELLAPSGGVIGRLELDLKDREVLSPRREEQQQYERHRCWLMRIPGKYVAKVEPYDSDFTPFEINLFFNLEDVVVNDMILPTLVARGRRSDGLSLAWRYNVVYRDDLTPEQLNLTPQAGARGYADFTVNSKYTLDPVTRAATMDGEINFPTFAGKFKASRVKGSELPLIDCKRGN